MATNNSSFNYSAGEINYEYEKLWLSNNWPNARAVDVNWTMERYDYPQPVRNYIFNNWVKVSDKNNGTYCEKNYFENLPENHQYKVSYKQIQKSKSNSQSKGENSEESNQTPLLKAIQYSGLVQNMDDYNKKALEVRINEGEKAMVEHMFKHPETARSLSYGEMRMYYG